jgi:hypothetical protein
VELDPNANVAMWSAIVGFLLPPAIAMVNRHAWSSTTKAIVAFVFCMIAAAGTTFFAGDLDKEGDLATAALTVFGAAIGTYRSFWQTSGIAPKLEEKTG